MFSMCQVPVQLSLFIRILLNLYKQYYEGHTAIISTLLIRKLKCVKVK